MLRKTLYNIANSIKSTVLHKPLAFVVLFCVIVMSTVICGIPTKMIITQIEEDMSTHSLGVSMDYAKMLDTPTYGDVMLSMYDNEAFNKNKCVVDVSISVNNLKINGKIAAINLYHEVTPNYFERKDIDEGAKKIVVNKELRELWGISYGEELTIFGMKFEVLEEIASIEYYTSSEYLVLPYTVDIYDYIESKYNLQSEGEECFQSQYISNSSVNLNRNPTAHEKERLLQIQGLIKEETIVNIPLIQCLIILMLILAICMISITLCYGYYLKLSERKISIYKVLGASPKRIAVLMVTENILVTSLAAMIGVLIDFVIMRARGVYNYVSLAWAHHLILFMITFVVVSAIGVIKIILRAIRMPIDKRMN